jgi:RNA polymerase sigma-70 factor, ECF subfamily
MKPSPDIDTASEESLVERATAGDHAAFDSLIRRHQARVYSLALRMVGKPEAAEEILQETFLHVYQKLASFRGEAKFTTWLYRVTTNAALMHRRSGRRHEGESLEECLPKFDEAGRMARLDLDYGRAARADELVERTELARKALDAVAMLPETYRAVFVLRDLEELDTAETAEVLGLDVEVVRTRLHRARLMLRGYLGRLTGGES